METLERKRVYREVFIEAGVKDEIFLNEKNVPQSSWRKVVVFFAGKFVSDSRNLPIKKRFKKKTSIITCANRDYHTPNMQECT